MSSSSTSKTLFQRLTPFITNRIRQNHRFLSSAAINQQLKQQQLKHEQDSSQQEQVCMAENCIRRLKELREKEATTTDGKLLRLSVETGGCSGFQYAFLLDDKINTDDRVFEKEGVKLVVDDVSYDFVKGATVDYVEELIRSAFVVTENPSAVGGCSCKSSFMVKP